MPKFSARLRWSRNTIDDVRDLKLIVSQRDFRSLSRRAKPGFYRGSDGRNSVTVHVVPDEQAA